MSGETGMAGGCLCGAIRYLTQGPLFYTSYCHCEDCRRATGAPVVVWSFFRGSGPEWTRGTPRLLRWAGRERCFCGECGTALLFRDPSQPGIYEMTTCSLDAAATVLPDDHNWTRDQLPWLQIADQLPRHATYTPV